MQETRAKLMALLAALDDQDARTTASRAVVELDQQAVGRLSRMDALQNQAMAEAQKRRRQDQRRRIRAALSRLEDGEYGFCVDCGDEIEAQRLAVDPTLALCADCVKAR